MRWIGAAVIVSWAAWAAADHGVPAQASPRLGWIWWLLISGAVVAVGLSAWALLAPTRPEDRPDPTPPRRSDRPA